MSTTDEAIRVVDVPVQRTESAPPPEPPHQGRSGPVVALVTVAVLALGGVVWAGVAAAPDAGPTPPAVGVPVELVHADALTAAGVAYRDYVAAEAVALRDSTAELVDLIADRRVPAAQVLYPAVRSHWERIQVAADFSELGAAIDGQGVGLDPGQEFTGFHRLERDLWRDGPQPDTDAIAERLLADVTALADAVPAAEFGGGDLCGGAKELIDFAVVTALPGFENRWADTDVADLAARVEGSLAAVDALRPLLSEVDPDLLATIDRRFVEAFAVLDDYRPGGTYLLHSTLTPEDAKRIADVLDALGEPVSRLGGAVMV